MNYTLPEIELLKIKTLEQVDNKGIFEIEPLSPGYGVTLGNSLRRVLLSSLEGSAITSVKIEGATHQFATLPKVKEDIVEIILNLKMLRFQMASEEPVVLKMQVKGPKDVTAVDFADNANCKIVNEDAYIASVAKGGTLKMEVTVAHGRGYVPVERRKEEKLPIGTISIDSIFPPVKKVHYEVENTRVGGMTNFDKLVMEITTDGSIDPEKALGKSAKILVEHFSLIENACAVTEVKAAESAPKKKAAKAEKKENPENPEKKVKKTTKAKK
jgi:DNA-directed RNA polymerase subunit alpha